MMFRFTDNPQAKAHPRTKRKVKKTNTPPYVHAKESFQPVPQTGAACHGFDSHVTNFRPLRKDESVWAALTAEYLSSI